MKAVKCPACDAESPPGARFCGECASPLFDSVACPGCGTSNASGQKFCNSCGHDLAGAADASVRDPSSYIPEHLAEKMLTTAPASEGERKQVTILFADIKGSMELAESVDTETWHGIMDRFFTILCDGVHRFEGTVNKFTGDGIMALFGAPIAHEDHARRACYTALHLGDELARYAGVLRRERGLSFSVRIGLNSGEVVVGTIGDDLRLDYTAIGHTVGLAQRMEALAEPGKAYLTEHTAALVSGYFELADLGPFELKGATEPLFVYELGGVGSMRTRLDVSRSRGFSRFIGRDEEVAQLESALEQAFAGNGQVVGVVGEPGLGKSRLCYELVQRMQARGIEVIEGHALAHGKYVPLAPIMEMLRGTFGVTDRDSDLTTREKIAGRLLLQDEGFRDDLPFVFEFLGVADPERPAPRMDPEANQRQLFAIGKRMVQTRSLREPAVYLVEDMHWLDDASDTFIANLVESVAGTRTLLLVNFRPEYHAGWMQKSYYRQLPLVPLGEEAIDALLGDLLGQDPSLDGLHEKIKQRTSGNPFFIEECVQALVESGGLVGERGIYSLVRPVEEVAIPATVQALLAARIDRLADREKSVLQTAAVIGKEFSEPILRRVADLPAGELEAALSALVSAEFLHEQALYPQPEYAFKHPLTQEVAYGSQLSERRAEVHAAVARAIEQTGTERLDEQAALLAHHFEQAGVLDEAAVWHRRAAQWSGAMHPAEAIRHWRKVRDLAKELEQSDETMELGTAACTQILNMGWRVGISDSEASETFAAGSALAERAGDVAALALLHGIYGAAKGLTGDVAGALELWSRAASLAPQVEDPALKVPLQFTGYWLYLAGDLRAALEDTERAMALTRDDLSLGMKVMGWSLHVWSVMFRGMLLWQMGRGKEAPGELDRAVELAGQEYPENLGWALGSYAWIAQITGETVRTLERAHEALEIAERLGSTFSQLIAHAQVGRAHNARGEWEEAAVAFERALALARERRTGLAIEGAMLAQLADSYLGRGDGPLALSTAEEAIEVSRRRGTRSMECAAQLALARACLRSDGAAGSADAIESALARALALVEETGELSQEPFVRVELAELAQIRGDEAARERELGAAQRLFIEIGAPKRAAELSPALAAPADD